MTFDEFAFLRELDDTFKAELKEQAMFVTIPSGMTMFEQGDKCNDILFLTEGKVRIYRLFKNGTELTLYYLNPGEMCNVNVSSAIQQSPAIGTAVSETEVKGYMIPANLIGKLTQQSPSYQSFIFSLFVNRMDSLVNLIDDIKVKTLDECLKEWIENQDEKVIFTTHDKLGDHFGTSREVMSRLLKEFEKKGVLKLSRGKIEIR
jgi:CRP/FNR family transcriptional regulator, anaerobic regulatory protein